MERVDVGRGDVNPYGIPMPNPHEADGPDECVVCGEEPGRPTRCLRCQRNMEEERLERESGR
jgi:hypothetical protein